ncbi:MAG: hypothetical protein GTN49_03040 [candidate division Zixibacteria bacterium]|nr:hypothetical protein [candidate division Zixibacteria bacterium]
MPGCQFNRRGLLLSLAALVAVASAAAAGAEVLAEPPYPTDIRDKPLRVNVVISGPLAGGEAADGDVLYNGGAGTFARAAVAAWKESTFEAARDHATIWYVFRLMRNTEANDVSRDRPRELYAPPELVEYVAPEFPPGAPSVRTEVTLDLFIGPDGAVWYAEPADEGATPLYVELAIAAARRFKFRPATLSGEPTATWYPFVFEFK